MARRPADTLVPIENPSGLGPPGVEKGDKICIFLGFTILFIIRPLNLGGYILVGECYIYGLMDGEAFSHGRNKDITLF